MPWGPEDAARHDKDADTPKKRRQWAHIANSALKRALEKGMPEKDAKVAAIRQASGTVESFSRRPLVTLSE